MGYQPPFYVYTDNLTILGNGTRQNPLYARFPDLYVTQDTVIAEPTDYNFIYITNNATLTLGSGSSTPAVTKVVTMQIDSGSSLILNSVQLNLFSPQPVLINGNIVSTNTNDLIIINSASFILNGNILLTGNIQINSQVTLNGNGQIVPIIYSITITNSQSSATPAPFQQMVQIPSTYIPYIRLTDSSGNLLYAWLESISNGTATIWVKLPNEIGANSSITIYVIGYDSGFDGNYWGEAPQLSSTYGQYDNGANVFTNYWNFAGTSTPSGITIYSNSGTGSITFNNGMTLKGGTSASPGQTTAYTTSSFSAPIIVDYYGTQSTSPSGEAYGWSMDGFSNANSNSGTYPTSGTSYTLLDFENGVNAGVHTTQGGAITNGGLSAPSGNLFSASVWTHIYTSSAYYTYQNYVNNTGYITGASNTASIPFELGVGNNEATYVPNGMTVNWLRTRAYPPNGVQPSVSFV